MDLLKETIKLCNKNNIKPARSRGQNFLINDSVYNRIVESANISKNDIVLEVGPGLGFLTFKLAANAKKVIAVELDKKLYKVLGIRHKELGIRNIEIINEDILDFQIPNSRFQFSNYKIVANLPYNITSIFLRKFLEIENKPDLMVLMLQKEVAERIVAEPGKMSLLAVSVQFYTEAEIVEYVPKQDFYPEPEVDSAIIKIEPGINRGDIDEKKFFQMVKFGFSQKRKMLKNNLSAGYQIKQKETEKLIIKAGLVSKIRAQELSTDDWIRLFAVIQENVL